LITAARSRETVSHREIELLMAYRLKADEPVTDGIKRVTLGEIDKAETMLSQDGEERDEGIHEARKSFKKIRAVLRLVRPSLGSAYAAENAWFRDVARDLSDLRDAQAVLESFDKLQNALPDQTNKEAFADIRAALDRRRKSLGENDNILARNVARVREDLQTVRQRVDSWDFKRTGFAAIGPGLRNTYRRGRQARVKAYDAPTDEAFHEWRKRVKYHWYHVRLLQDLWPDMLKPSRASLKELSDILGDDHDLVVMKQTIAQIHSDGRDSAACGAYVALVNQRQEHLRAAARSLGDRIYAEKPKCLHGRFRSYWQTWRGET
jgi:CHAD domain-containing protein